MRALYGSMEQVLQTLRNTTYKTEGISLTIVPESSQQVLRERIGHVLWAKDSEKIFQVSMNYVGSISRSTVVCSETLKGTDIISWVMGIVKEKKIASFLLIVKLSGQVNREASLYFFTTL